MTSHGRRGWTPQSSAANSCRSLWRRLSTAASRRTTSTTSSSRAGAPGPAGAGPPAIEGGVSQRLHNLETVQNEMIGDVYRNFIRCEMSRSIRVREWHAKVAPWVKALAGRPQVSHIQVATFHLDILMKTMVDTKGNAEPGGQLFQGPGPPCLQGDVRARGEPDRREE
mmetsp:Transcript_90271/g.279264  ORF Transcript_90271/g.279264 Transcript_90271/m.279264 type:complete len:168 (-) Transcript_90271:384-887(-)